jgi:tRNA pseudouridine55 synthase
MSLVQAKEMEGVLIVDKPQVLTSHDVVYRLRRKLGMKKIGHAGTLDPMATGLLIMLIGKATRISQYLMSTDKVYEGEATLGVVTDSQDAEGEMMETRPVPELSEAAVREVHERIPRRPVPDPADALGDQDRRRKALPSRPQRRRGRA